jgi:diadenosine tetraphosphatase ApaH/serine/threonine PP2A family protein phosphatase
LRYAIISDIHANLEAFRSVLEEIEGLNVERTICLGDIVGYGANPNECIEIIRSQGIISLMGNHDSAACGRTEPIDFNPVAAEAVLWTRETLTEENRIFLGNLPEKEVIDGFLTVHGAISDPDKYILSTYDAAPEFRLLEYVAILCFFGHTHVSVSYSLDKGRIADSRAEAISLRKGVKYLVNPGSVGQPRDKDPRASCLVYDSRGDVEFRRVEYPIEGAQRKIIESGLNGFLAERLSHGY